MRGKFFGGDLEDVCLGSGRVVGSDPPLRLALLSFRVHCL
jgi:hypothetical protein